MTAPSAKTISLVAVVAARLTNLKMWRWGRRWGGRGGTVGWKIGVGKGKTRLEKRKSNCHLPPHITMDWSATTDPCFSLLRHYVLCLARPVKTVFSLCLFTPSYLPGCYPTQLIVVVDNNTVCTGCSRLPVWVQFRWSRLSTYLAKDRKQWSWCCQMNICLLMFVSHHVIMIGGNSKYP